MVTVSLAKRMRKLRSRVSPPSKSVHFLNKSNDYQLLDIRLGPGAALLSPTTTRLHLIFARKINDGHRGPRQFWHHYLPRLKYHNPGVAMSVARSDDQKGPAVLNIFFADGDGASSSSSSGSVGGVGIGGGVGPTERTRSINMKHKKEDEILDELMRICAGKQIVATPAEEEQLRELESERMSGEADRVRQAKVLKDRRRQQDILKQAKASMDNQ